jgi:predicted PurR-regulated permease PerM
MRRTQEQSGVTAGSPSIRPVPAEPRTAESQTRVHPTIDALAASSWRLLVIAAAFAGLLWVVGRIWVVFVPLLVAVFLTRILVAPATWLRTRRVPGGLAAAATLVGFLIVLSGVSGLVGVAVANQFAELGPTVTEAVDDLERWVVEDSPFGLDQARLDRFRRDASRAAGQSLRASGGALASGAALAAEVVLGLVVGLIITFFFLKDGGRLVSWARRHLPEHRRELGSRLATRSWRTLGAYLRGCALLGLVEGLVIGLALTVVGAELAIPMALITFLAAFVPVVGAVVAGVLSILVALATAGVVPAVIVAGVALAVQQLDNDILAPLVYGRALQLHPIVVLLAILAGGSAFGLVGSFLAVPVVAVVVNALAEARAYREQAPPSPVT